MAARTEVDGGPPSGPGRGWDVHPGGGAGYARPRRRSTPTCQSLPGGARRIAASQTGLGLRSRPCLALGSPPARPREDCTAPPRHSLELPSGTAAGLSPHSATAALPPRHSGLELAILIQRTMDCPWNQDAQTGLGPAGFAFWNLRERS